MSNKLLKYDSVIYILGLFFSLVVFNTTHMQLGTILPISLMAIFTILFITGKRKMKIELYKVCFLLMALVLFSSTAFNAGQDYRVVFKVFLLAFFYMIATSVDYKETEIRFFSKMIVYTYLLYALYLLFGTEKNEFYSRQTLIIFGSELDPNIVAAVFVLPIVLLLYNIIYEKKHRIINAGLLFLFVLAVVITGSRGGFVGMLTSVSFLIFAFMSDKKIKFAYKIIAIGLIVIALFEVYTYLMSAYGDYLTRSLSFTGDTGGGDGRTAIWAERLFLLSESPLFGCGMIFDRGLWHGWANHNTYVQVLYGSGFMGLILFIIPLVIIYRRSNNKLIMSALFFSVFIPIFFLDTLDNRLLWNALIFFDIISRHDVKRVIAI